MAFQQKVNQQRPGFKGSRLSFKGKAGNSFTGGIASVKKVPRFRFRPFTGPRFGRGVAFKPRFGYSHTK